MIRERFCRLSLNKNEMMSIETTKTGAIFSTANFQVGSLGISPKELGRKDVEAKPTQLVESTMSAQRKENGST